MSEFDSKITIAVLQETAQRLGPDIWRQASDVAQVVAVYLAAHPKVVSVRYPGLKTDSLFDEASKTVRSGFGPYVWYKTAAGAQQMIDCTGVLDAKAYICELEHIIK